MNGIRKALCFALALVLAAFVTPGLAAAPQKLYAINFASTPTYTSGQLNVPVAATVTVKNESNAGANSNIGSFRFTLVGMTIVGVSCTGANCAPDPAAPNTVTVQNINPPIQAPGGTFTVSLSLASCGDGSVPVSPSNPLRAKVWNGQLKGAEFAPNTTGSFFDNTESIRCGDIDCGNAFTVPNSTNPSANAPENVAGVRSLYDTDGTCAAGGADSVPYTVTNTLSENFVLNFAWPVSVTQSPDFDPFAAFGFKVNIEAPASANPQVKFSWGGGPFIPAQPCTLPTATSPPAAFTDLPLPAPYAVLSQDAAPTDTKIKVDTSAGVVPVPTADEFDIMMGAERLRVTKHTTNTWDVVRHTGLTPAATTTYPAGTQVVRTAQEIVNVDLPPYYPAGDKTQACLAFGPHYNGDDDGTWSAWIVTSGDPGVFFSP